MGQAYKTRDFYQRYGKSMAQMGRELGITKEAVRKRWLKKQPMVAQNIKRRLPLPKRKVWPQQKRLRKGTIEYYRELNERLLIRQRQRLTQ